MNNQEKFLPEKYLDLPGSKPVERAVQKKLREGEKGPTTKEERVETYLDRLEDIIKEPMGFRKEEGERGGFELLKQMVLDKYTTKYEEIPESYWKAQEEEIRRRGEAADWAQATEKQKEEVKRKTAEAVLTDQRASLEQWVDYFASLDSDHIPRNLKYWVFRNVLGLQELVKKKEDDREYIEFPKRSKGTVKPFPDINHEALAYVIDAMVKKLQGQGIEFEYDIQPEECEEFLKFLQKQDFAKLYAWANELIQPIPEHLLPITEGRWVKYPQNSNPEALVKTIRGRGTGWCTAGLNTARTHLQGGDFYVYYSLDDNGEPTMPRIAIRMEGHDKIAEDPRGIAYKQNLDPYMGSVLEEKLKEFGTVGDAYKKKSADMKQLTEIEITTKQNEPLTKDDLIFLYEIDNKIEGFGYQGDPRIKELRGQRNPEEDLLVIFECSQEQIARSVSDIREDTKAYVGKLEPGIFDILKQYNIEHIYTSFPEGKIRREDLEIGGKDYQMFINELDNTGIQVDFTDWQKVQDVIRSGQLEAKNISQGTRDFLAELVSKQTTVSHFAQDMLQGKDFTTLKNREQIDLVWLKVKDLGFEISATTAEIYHRAEELGLELCPAEVGPDLRLKHQSFGKGFSIGMKQIADRLPAGHGGGPRVFNLEYYEDGLSVLRGSYAGPNGRWGSNDEFVFRLRKSFLSVLQP